MKCPFGMAHWQVRSVSFRECNLSMGDFVSLSSSLIHDPIEDEQMECFHYRCPGSRVNHHFKTWWFFVWMKNSYEKKKQVKFVNQPKKWFLDSSGASFNSTIPKIDVELMDADREPTAYPKLVNHTGDEFDRKWPENKPLLGVVFFVFWASFKSKHVRISWIPYIACSSKDLYIPNDSSNIQASMLTLFVHDFKERR